LLRKPALSLEEIDSKLGSPDGVAELEGTFRKLLEAHYADQAQREQIHRAFAAFDHAARARQVADRWLLAAPDSPFALVASAHQYEQSGWKARGERRISETPADQVTRMQQAFIAAVPQYAKALERDPKISPACVGLMRIGRQSSSEIESIATAACMKVDPDSYHVAWEAIRAAQPRWGGSEAAMRHAVAYAAARVDRNPILGALVGEAAGDPLSMADDFGTVANELERVAKMAPSGTLNAHAGRGYKVLGDDWRALVYLSQALRFWPRNSEWREERAAVLMRLGDYGWAESDMRIALRESPGDGWYQYRMGQIQRELPGGESAARPYFGKAMDDPGSRRAAIAMYCQGLLLQKRIAEGADCTREMVEEFPDHGEGWRLRAWVLEELGDGAAAASARASFVKYADPRDQLHQRLLREMQDEAP
jgi:tetratricopeptide (TPR) repeat protein